MCGELRPISQDNFQFFLAVFQVTVSKWSLLKMHQKRLLPAAGLLSDTFGTSLQGCTKIS